MDRTKCGHVTKSQFGRIMHMIGFELNEQEISLLAAAYCDLGNHNDFNYVDFSKSCDPPSQDVEIAMQQYMAAPEGMSLAPKYFDSHGGIKPLDRCASAVF